MGFVIICLLFGVCTEHFITRNKIKQYKNDFIAYIFIYIGEKI